MGEHCENFTRLNARARYNCGLISRVTEVCVRFLRGKKQVIYGGQAIHFALMRKGSALYDESEVPDYDVQTPDNFTDALEFSTLLINEGLEEVALITALHPQTVRVRVGSVYAMDFTFCNKSLFKVIKDSALEWDGMLFRHPYVQFMDQLMPFSRPFDRAKVENVFYRWNKDYTRLKMLSEFYPPPQALVPELGKRVRLSDNGVNAWYGALAVYGDLTGNNWLELVDGEFSMPIETPTASSGAQSAGAQFGSPDPITRQTESGMILEHLPTIYVGKLSGEFRAPVGEYVPARSKHDGQYQLTIGPEHFCTSPRTVAIHETKHGKVACCESVLGMLLYHWMFNNCATCCYYFGKLWELYLSEEHKELFPSVNVFGNPRDMGVVEYLSEHKAFAKREKPPSLFFSKNNPAELNWVPQEMYRLDGHLVEADDFPDEPILGGAPTFEIVVYGRSSCPYSQRAANIPGAHVVMDDHAKLRELSTAYSWQTVPIIFENGIFVGGLSNFLSTHEYLSL